MHVTGSVAIWITALLPYRCATRLRRPGALRSAGPQAVFPDKSLARYLVGHAYSVVNGISISYSDSGGDGPAVVLSHGYLMDSTMFAPQVAALAPAVPGDHLGRARLRRHPGDRCVQLLGLRQRRARPARHLGIQQAVLGGMSQGGFLSLRAALLAPERVRALVLIDSQAGLEDPAAAPAYEQMERIWLEHGPAPVQDIVASIILGPPDGPVDYPPWFAKWAAADRDELRSRSAA